MAPCAVESPRGAPASHGICAHLHSKQNSCDLVTRLRLRAEAEENCRLWASTEFFFLTEPLPGYSFSTVLQTARRPLGAFLWTSAVVLLIFDLRALNRLC